MRLSIRYKILAVTGFLLLLAVGFYTLLASIIFIEQKTALLYEINHSVAVNSAAQIRTSLEQVGDRLQLYALSRLISGRGELNLPASSLRESHILGMGLYQEKNGNWESVKLPAEFPGPSLSLQEIRPQLQEALKSGKAFWRVETPERKPTFFLASRVQFTLGKSAQTYLTLAEMDPKPFLETILSTSLFESYLAKPSGEVLIHLKNQKEEARARISDHPLLSSQRPTTSGVQAYRFQGTPLYGAFAPVDVAGLFFISQADQSEVTSALTVLIQRSLLFGLIVVTVTFIASVLFSKTLTRNLQKLTQGASAIGSGNLNTHIEVRSKDEVGVLAHSFNKMIDALKTSREAIEKYNRELEDKVATRTQQLSETNATIKEVQEKLVQTSQLAAVGELAGRTAHELLNPLTAILSRIERSRVSLQPAGVSVDQTLLDSLPAQLLQILQAWKQDYTQGGVAQLTQNLQQASTVTPGKTLLEEDLDNLEKLAHFWQDQTQVVAGDLDFVRDQAQRIHRIIDGMRTLVRSSAKEEVSCKGAIEEAAATMADFFFKHGVKVQVDWQATLDRALLNRDELIQILTNLLRNAYQAIQETHGPGAILVQAQNRAGFLVVEVIDNGSGISIENQPKIFQQGFTTKSPDEGTGLGLAICRRYAHAFGGEVELVYSDKTHGTCFRISIPLCAEEAVA
jgi:signal transduction histidine kinase